MSGFSELLNAADPACCSRKPLDNEAVFLESIFALLCLMNMNLLFGMLNKPMYAVLTLIPSYYSIYNIAKASYAILKVYNEHLERCEIETDGDITQDLEEIEEVECECDCECECKGGESCGCGADCCTSDVAAAAALTALTADTTDYSDMPGLISFAQATNELRQRSKADKVLKQLYQIEQETILRNMARAAAATDAVETIEMKLD